MHALVVYCHPCADSFTAAVRDVVISTLRDNGHETTLIDLYAEAFDPVMSERERRGYHDIGPNLEPVAHHAAILATADAVVFVYPTWIYGLPAMLKGWLDRLLVPGFAFEMPNEHRGARPKLLRIRHVVALTSGGATSWLSWIMGRPGRHTLLRGFRSNCHPACRGRFLALYKVDTATPKARSDHLARVRHQLLRIFG